MLSSTQQKQCNIQDQRSELTNNNIHKHNVKKNLPGNKTFKNVIVQNRLWAIKKQENIQRKKEALKKLWLVFCGSLDGLEKALGQHSAWMFTITREHIFERMLMNSKILWKDLEFSICHLYMLPKSREHKSECLGCWGHLQATTWKIIPPF